MRGGLAENAEASPRTRRPRRERGEWRVEPEWCSAERKVPVSCSGAKTW